MEGDPLAGRTVMQVVPALDAGGTERTTLDVAAALAQVGARPLVVSRGGRLEDELATLGGVLLRFPADRKNPAVMAAAVPRLAALIRREGTAIVHARSRAPAWVALAAARLAGVPFVTTWHGSYSGRTPPKRFYNSVMARGDVVIANSAWTAEEIRHLHPPAAERLAVIPRGTAFSRFAPTADTPGRVAAMRARWGIGAGERVVLLAARLTAWKGHMLLLDALARLCAEGGGEELVAVFAGDPQGRDDYVRRIDVHAARLGLAGRVRRVGHESDIATALRAADVVAVPSTQPEAFGRVAVEAQAVGTPVVVADHGAVAETVLAPPAVSSDARTGWRVAPNDAAALAEGLAAALALAPDARAALAARAARHVARFSVEAMTGATLAVYRRLLRSPPAGRR
ncbi:MAG TPA: glycosyltransferase [Hyphomicrobiales bacterium]|nr:glycosyltransferase [Hyphomicrobiales bacterium]